jgi:hypothetical protein
VEIVDNEEFWLYKTSRFSGVMEHCCGSPLGRVSGGRREEVVVVTMLKKIVVGIYQANCYLRIRAILITPGHLDHTGGADKLRRITGSPIRVHPSDAAALGFRADAHLSHGKEISVGRFKVKVLHTPCHSPGVSAFTPPAAARQFSKNFMVLTTWIIGLPTINFKRGGHNPAIHPPFRA